MAKRTPDRKVAQGFTVGSFVAVIGWVMVNIFHHSLTPQEAAALVGALGLFGHFFGSYFAPYVPRVDEVVAYVKKLLSEVPPAV